MRKKEFKERVDNYIKTNSLGYFTLLYIIEDDKKSLFNGKSVIKLIKDNIIYIFDNCTKVFEMYVNLYKYEELRSVLEENLLYCISISDFSSLYDFFTKYRNKDRINKLINDNFEYLLDKIKLGDLISLFYMKDKLKLNDINKELFNKVLLNNRDVLVSYFFSKKYNANNESSEYKAIMEVIGKLLDELCNNQNCKYVDIVMPYSGQYSNVMIIGDKVLKLGSSRETYIIPNDKRLLKPLIRIDLSSISNYSGTIEVVNKVNTKVNLTHEQLYDLYKELRLRKIVFTDIKNDNLGILLKDNNYNWSSELSDDQYARGVIGKNEEVLKAGEIVIIDSDFIFNENDPNIKYVTALSRVFENRYKREMGLLEEDLSNSAIENEIKDIRRGL